MIATRPLIAIDGELVTERMPTSVLPVRYAAAIYRAGGLPLILPPLSEREHPGFLEQLLQAADGILLAGGDDFDTESLGLGPTHPSAKPVPPSKQAFDIELARAALAAKLPILGVCYGMQLLALAEGGDLHQHIPEDRPGSREHRGGVRHSVSIERNSKLGRLLQVSEVSVVSRHHQALSATGPMWRPCGVDGEGLIEAVERIDHPFAIGVQWHPELDVAPDDKTAAATDGEVHLRLFNGLIDAASSNRPKQQRTALTTS